MKIEVNECEDKVSDEESEDRKDIIKVSRGISINSAE